MDAVPDIEYHREMGLTHDDFWRLLPRAMGEHSFTREGDQVHAQIHQGRLTITLGPTQRRRIALLDLPFSVVLFKFEGVHKEQQMEFKTYFDLRFQRGGG